MRSYHFNSSAKISPQALDVSWYCDYIFFALLFDFAIFEWFKVQWGWASSGSRRERISDKCSRRRRWILQSRDPSTDKNLKNQQHSLKLWTMSMTQIDSAQRRLVRSRHSFRTTCFSSVHYRGPERTLQGMWYIEDRVCETVRLFVSEVSENRWVAKRWVEFALPI